MRGVAAREALRICEFVDHLADSGRLVALERDRPSAGFAENQLISEMEREDAGVTDAKRLPNAAPA